MRAVALGPDRHLAVVDRPEPEPGPDEVVVAVERCGICGSDLHLLASGLLPVGAVLGHEVAGTVVALGTAVTTLAEGTRVAVLPARRCGACAACRAGRDNLCAPQLATVIGFGLNDGGWAERVRVPAASCHPLPERVAPEAAALTEPYAVALHALARSRVAAEPGLRVGVLGAGSVGLACVAALRRAGAEHVAAAEPRPRRAAAARRLGAAVAERADALAAVLGAVPDVVFEAAGTTAAPALALDAVAPGGQVVLLGVVGPGEVLTLPGLAWVTKEVDVVPAVAYTSDEFAAAVAAVAAGAADDLAQACELRPLDGAADGIEELARAEGPVKIQLAP